VHFYSKILGKTQSNACTPTSFGVASRRTAPRHTGPRPRAPGRLGVRAPRRPRRRAPQGPLKFPPPRAVCQPYPASDRPDGPPSDRWSPWCPPCRARRPRLWAPRRLDGHGRAQVQTAPPALVAYKASPPCSGLRPTPSARPPSGSPREQPLLC
jgi:hypothetical protein